VVLDKLLANLSVEVRPFALCLVSRGWRLRLPEPPVPLLHFVLRGEGTIRGDRAAPVPVQPSWLAVVPPGVPHALEGRGPIEHEHRASPPQDVPVCQLAGGSDGDADLVVACGLVNVRYGRTIDLFAHVKDVLVSDLSSVPAVRTAFDGILSEQAGLAPGSVAMTNALMSQCLVHFFRHLMSTGSLPWLDALDDPRLGRAIDRMLEDPGGRHTVASLADSASMSRSAFADRFTSAFGQTPMMMLHHLRMQHAAHLLRQGDTLSLDQVAARAGYASRSHFSTAFRRHHGLSPADFRAGAS